MGLQALLESHEPFDLALIMLGTNDLAVKGMTAKKVVNNIQILHRVCHMKSIPTVALSIPDNECVPDNVKELRKRGHDRGYRNKYHNLWCEANDLLREWADS